MVETLEGRNDPVKQFSIFTQNKLGKLFGIIRLLDNNAVHVLAITSLDNTDSSVLRLIVDDPDRARLLFGEYNVAFSESEVLVLELKAADDLIKALSSLLQAEINIHYTYALISRPWGRSALALSLEDRDVASQALRCQGFKVLTQRDISR